MLDLALLGLLREGQMHGYELHQRLIGMGFWRISFGSVYPALRRLERAGFIAVAAGSGRRKSYTLTEAGQLHFDELLGDVDAPVDNTSAFRVRLSLFRYLPQPARVAFLQSRRGVLERRLAALQAALETSDATDQGMDRYVRSEMEHRATVATADIAWIESLLEQELTDAR